MAKFRVEKNDKDEFYWTFNADNGKMIARSSEGYDTRQACLHSILLVKQDSLGAAVYDYSSGEMQTITNLR